MNAELLFRLLSDSTRLRSVVMLRAERSLCVCELTHALELSQPKISRHLAMLREGGLVIDERRGQWVHYRLNDDLPHWALQIIDAAVAGQRASGLDVADSARLQSMQGRPSAEICT